MRALGRVYVPADSPSARILPVEFKGGPGIVFGKDQCDRFAGLPHGKPGWALPAALFAPINLKRSVLFLLLRISPCLVLSVSLSYSLLPLPSNNHLRAFCSHSTQRLAQLRQENGDKNICIFDNV